MKRISWFLLVIFFVYIFFVLFARTVELSTENIYPNPYDTSKSPAASFEGLVDENVDDLQVPIPMEDRVPNRTGIQCVWSSIETLARYCGEDRLYNLTYNDNYKGYARPSSARKMFEEYGIEYEMTTDKKDKSLLIKGCMVENRGCGFDIPGHVMTMVHYDEEKGIVKYIDNSDPKLKIRVWSMDEFNKRWGGWVFIIRAKNDRMSALKDIPIKDRNSEQGSYNKNYIFFPK
jgi:hypothetical protein